MKTKLNHSDRAHFCILQSVNFLNLVGKSGLIFLGTCVVNWKFVFGIAFLYYSIENVFLLNSMLVFLNKHQHCPINTGIFGGSCRPIQIGVT